MNLQVGPEPLPSPRPAKYLRSDTSYLAEPRTWIPVPADALDASMAKEGQDQYPKTGYIC